MSWLEKNPVGVALLGACGLLVLVGLVLTVAWGGAASSGDAGSDAAGDMTLPEVATARELGTLRDYEVVLNRPVFNDTRRPIIIDQVTPEEIIEVAEPEYVVADPPKVRLTGVVITPTDRFVTLTPESGGEALVLREGMPLDGEYVGWTVREVKPRTVSLASSRGQRLEFELSVHDAMIAEPPEPQPRAPAEEATPVDGGDVAPTAATMAIADGGAATQETRSRADEIRERIRQRREELREEADQQAESQADDAEARANAYQEAIQSMIRRGSSSNNNEEQNDSDDSGDN